MSTATEAILVYGYNLGSPDDGLLIRELDADGRPILPWYEGDFADDAVQALLLAAGFSEVYSPGLNAPGYFRRKREAEAHIGVELEMHCSHEYPLYVLSAKKITASRGEVLPVHDLDTEPEWDANLATALLVLGMTPLQERPAWLLCSWWG